MLLLEDFFCILFAPSVMECWKHLFTTEVNQTFIIQQQFKV